MDEFIIYLQPGREAMIETPTDEEAAKVQEHFEYLKRLTDEGTVIMAGRTSEPPFAGLVVLRAADREAAASIMNGDPAVKAGVFSARLSPFRLALIRGEA